MRAITDPRAQLAKDSKTMSARLITVAALITRNAVTLLVVKRLLPRAMSRIEELKI